jgi:hypothetical protein
LGATVDDACDVHYLRDLSLQDRERGEVPLELAIQGRDFDSCGNHVIWTAALVSLWAPLL